MNIDTSDWIDFTIGDLFTVSRPIVRSQAKYNDGDIAFVASGNANNGVVKWCEPHDDEALDAGNCITVSPLDGSAFYQKNSFLGRGGAGSAILILRNDTLNEMTGLFISTALRIALAKYSYTNQLNSQTIINETIRLPADKSGKPDWTHMYNYMARIIEQSKIDIATLKNNREAKHVVASRNWRKFSIGGARGLFRIEKGTRLTRTSMKDGIIPFIGASTANNGITGYVGNTEYIHPGNVITVAYNGQKATGKAFYQPNPFWASDDVHVLYPSFELNELRALFLLPIFRIVGKPYAFEDKWKIEYMEKDQLPLPVDDSGMPDWSYMESYMSEVLRKCEEGLNNLTQMLK